MPFYPRNSLSGGLLALFVALLLPACAIESGLGAQDGVLEKNKLVRPDWVGQEPGLPYEQDGRVMVLLTRLYRQNLPLGVEQMQIGLPLAAKLAWRQAETQGKLPTRLSAFKPQVLQDKAGGLQREDFYFERVEALSQNGERKDFFYNLYFLVSLGALPAATH